MKDAPTSLVTAPGLRAEWSAYRAFLASPSLPVRAAPASSAALRATGRMLVLDIILMSLLTLAMGLAVAAGLNLPDTELARMEIGAVIALFAVVIAPLGEEIAFRGWLSGRPGHLLALAIVAAGLFVTTQTGLTRMEGPVNYKTIGVASLTIGAAIAALLVLRRRPAVAWFQRLFPAFFWLSTLAFACVHLANYEEGAAWILLPLVFPQFVVGTILGYLRVHYGLWASVLLHGAHNALALGIALVAMRVSGAGG